MHRIGWLVDVRENHVVTCSCGNAEITADTPRHWSAFLARELDSRSQAHFITCTRCGNGQRAQPSRQRLLRSVS
ncbi:hypothetical protein SAMN05661010_00352 [Modicisalibacter muralis]|uniref:Uncharacterized protein n=1 Tax=Modicisalibacter muralis TaxID=119000 RepID=A0A1G9FE44_9GAMM|nr:hypothetical protein [Halomonas muralis]SDK86661.1 hypothetical protein SAMN05661010_00352 [Halomonas muralis]